MRRIGTLSSEPSAQRFVDYLYTQSIDALLDGPSPAEGDATSGVWELWVRDERDVERARAALSAFHENPSESRFDAKQEADRLRDERIDRESRRIAQHRQRTDESTADEPVSVGELDSSEVVQKSIPLTIAIIAICVFIGFTANFDQPRGSAKPGEVTLEKRIYSVMSFVDREDFVLSGGDPFASIRKGEVWRLITPLFLHGNILHLSFNMLWLFFLGSAIERLHGSFVFAALILVTQIAGMMLQVAIPPLDWIPQSLHGSPFAIGASGAVYGLFGFLMVRPLVDAKYPIQLDPINVTLMMGWLIACIALPITGVANGAHLGGLLGGVVIGAAGYITKRR